MQRIRAYLVAKDLGVSTTELLGYFATQGIPVASALAAVDAGVAQQAREHFSRVEDIVPRHSLAFSAAATFGVAVAPTFVAFSTLVFGQPDPRPFLAILMSVLLTAGAIVLGSAIWNTQPESAGFSFGDLMLWSWVRRDWAERRLVNSTATLGFHRDGTFLGTTTASPHEQMLAVREVAAALDASSSYTLGHSKRVEKHARQVAEALGLSTQETEALATAAALHDIGNISLPDTLLRKTGELTIEERSSIEAHVLLGAMMVHKAGNEDVVKGIQHHHERWDGAGYPSSLAGEDIPLYARIVSIAEAYDAMTSTRPYRQGFGRQHAIEVLRAEAGFQFDSDLVETFVSTLPQQSSIVSRFAFLRNTQRQAQELKLVFMRMGAVAVSAIASTIAIALILGSTILSNGVPDDVERRTPRRIAAPVDRVLGERLVSDGALLADVVPAEGIVVAEAAPFVTDGFAQVRSGMDGGGVDIVGSTDGGSVEGPPVVVPPDPDPSPGGTPGPGTGGGNGGGNGNAGGGTGGGDTDPDPVDGGTTTPDPTPTQPGPGNSNGHGNATGHGNGNANGHAGGNGNANGHANGNGNGNGNSGGTGTGPSRGNSANAPGHADDEGTTTTEPEAGGSTSEPKNNGNSANAPGHDDDRGNGNDGGSDQPADSGGDSGGSSGGDGGSVGGAAGVTGGDGGDTGNGNGNGNSGDKDPGPPADRGNGNSGGPKKDGDS